MNNTERYDMSFFGVRPVTGSKGRFGTMTPFDIVIDGNLEYEVLEVRTIGVLKDSGKDVFKDVYQVVGLSEDIYNEDILNRINIATLLSPSNDYLYVPVNRFTSIPKTLGPVYGDIAIAVNLGMVPIDLDISHIEDSIKHIVLGTLGKLPTTKIIEIGSRVIVDKDEDSLYRDKVFNASNDEGSLQTRYNTMVRLNADLTTEINKYKEYVMVKENS